MNRAGGEIFSWWAAATVLLGAFLLFLVQPIISKIILPWFGGGPSVWTSCMLFFQVMLVAGYVYAHLLTRQLVLRRQIIVHVFVCVVALLTLPIMPIINWEPDDAANPTTRILLLLLVCVGLPYAVLAANGPLVQAWFALRHAGRSPYRLYALSNVGSLGALVCFPLVVEPLLSSPRQAGLWSWGFGLFALLMAVLLGFLYRYGSAAGPLPENVLGDVPSAPAVTGRDRLLWFLLPAVASVMLLAVTNHLCQDVAVIPFLWVAPLILYLLSFIICFDRELWYRRIVTAGALVVLLLLTSLLYRGSIVYKLFEEVGLSVGLGAYTGNIVVISTLYLVLLFVICMMCHGELVRSKPPPKQLTSFYLLISIGGAIGGLFVSLLCPLLFPGFWELNMLMIVGYFAAGGILVKAILKYKRPIKVVMTLALVVGAAIVVDAQWGWMRPNAIVRQRNFYGVLRIVEAYADKDELHHFRLVHGGTLHGLQFQMPDKKKLPTTYYSPDSGIGIALRYQQGCEKGLKIGTIGLGVGTMASYGREGDVFHFYEIDPNVISVAREHFSFLNDSPSEISVFEGDARLTLESRLPQRYDLLAVDAFSSGAIPVHLLTNEAFALYLRHLKPAGVMAVHVSNRHLDLVPVVARLAHYNGCRGMLIRTGLHPEKRFVPSFWILITRDSPSGVEPIVYEAAKLLPEDDWKMLGEEDRQGGNLWTDSYSNLLEVLR